MRSVVVKVEWNPFGEPWEVRDQKGDVVKRKIDPKRLPERVRTAVAAAKRAFFHVTVDGDQLMFGNRVVGDPGWL